MSILTTVRRHSIDRLLAAPIRTRHAERSMVFSADDDRGPGPTTRLIDLALDSIAAARSINFTDLSDRLTEGPRYFDVWPGEHYKLLAGLISVLRPRTVVEIGTGAGLGCLAMRKYLGEGSNLITFDIVSWQKYPGSILNEADFRDGHMTQAVWDWNNPATLSVHGKTIAAADLIFLDAAKDGVLEDRVLDVLANVQRNRKSLLVLDDIRVWNMLRIWRSIERPKLDLTSFGHWSGTGIVEWT